MKKACLLISLLLLLNIIQAQASGIYDSLDQNTKQLIQKSIGIQEKIKTCTPAQVNYSPGGITVYGMKNGLCEFRVSSSDTTLTNSKTNETVNTSNCNYKITASEAQKYANYNIKLIKALYQINGVTISDSEAEVMGDYLFNLAKKYCN